MTDTHKYVNPRCEAKVSRCGLRPGCCPYNHSPCMVLEAPRPEAVPLSIQSSSSGWRVDSARLHALSTLVGGPALTLQMTGCPQGCRAMTQKKPGSWNDWQGQSCSINQIFSLREEATSLLSKPPCCRASWSQQHNLALIDKGPETETWEFGTRSSHSVLWEQRKAFCRRLASYLGEKKFTYCVNRGVSVGGLLRRC